MYINNYFWTPIWSEHKPEFVKSLNKASNKYIKEAKNREKKYIKEYGDFGRSYHSTPLTQDNDFLDFRNCLLNRIRSFKSKIPAKELTETSP